VKQIRQYTLAAAVILMLSPVSGLTVHAQGINRPASAPPKTLLLNEDSLIAAATTTSDTIVRPGKSTTIAMLSSMALPGAGQIYNGSYWKAPVIWGTGVYLWSIYRGQNDLYQVHKKAYTVSITSQNAAGDGRERQLRDFYNRQRDSFGWYMAIAYIVNVLDAYVDASLYGFEVSPNLQPKNDIQMIGLQVRF
jgi:hypothetical protein